MIIYLDESGDLGFDLNKAKTSRYLVIGLLVFFDTRAHSRMKQAVKRTLKNKLPKNTPELKGCHLSLSIKKYFLKTANKENNWSLYAAIADKKCWVKHYISKYRQEPNKKDLYNEIAKRLFSQLWQLQNTQRIDIVVDRSKNKDEILVFDQAIKSAVQEHIKVKIPLSIKHRCSKEDFCLQAIDLFCTGIGKKYESANLAWYQEFADKIAVEVEYKF